MYAFLAKLARHRRRRRQASHSTLPRPRSFRLERYDTVSERESRGRIAIDSEIKDNVVDRVISARSWMKNGTTGTYGITWAKAKEQRDEASSLRTLCLPFPPSPSPLFPLIGAATRLEAAK